MEKLIKASLKLEEEKKRLESKYNLKYISASLVSFSADNAYASVSCDYGEEPKITERYRVDRLKTVEEFEEHTQKYNKAKDELLVLVELWKEAAKNIKQTEKKITEKELRYYVDNYGDMPVKALPKLREFWHNISQAESKEEANYHYNNMQRFIDEIRTQNKCRSRA